MILINPGTHGDIDWTLEQAHLNLGELLAKLDFEVQSERTPSTDDGGRYGWKLRANGRKCTIDVPGCPSKDLHWGTADPFPVRYYVDGSSWQFDYALSQVNDILTGAVEE